MATLGESEARPLCPDVLFPVAPRDRRGADRIVVAADAAHALQQTAVVVDHLLRCRSRRQPGAQNA
jgi:hypothetical protein